jgi:hypothetical protein
MNNILFCTFFFVSETEPPSYVEYPVASETYPRGNITFRLGIASRSSIACIVEKNLGDTANLYMS